MKKEALASPTRKPRVYECSVCQDREYIIEENVAKKECVCKARKQAERIAKKMQETRSSIIPVEFFDATFQNFRRNEDWQKIMWQKAVDYVMHFELIQGRNKHSFGMVAQVGESELITKPIRERMKLLEQKNSYGIGKTHLSVAIAKVLMDKGYNVMIVNDAEFLEDLAEFRVHNITAFRELIDHAKNVDVLVWDDLGKANPSEFTVRTVYRIVDERNRMRRPIIFSSNESLDTLDVRLLPATMSRLIGMTELLEVRGEDQR